MQNKKNLIAYALLFSFLGEQISADSTNTKLYIAGGLGLATVVASPFIWRHCTKHQDGQVATKIDAIRTTTAIPKARKDLNLNQHNEGNIEFVLQKLHPTSNEAMTARAIYACNPREVINSDKAAIKNCLTYDLWGRSWFNPTLATKREELKQDKVAIKEIECFTNQHASFLYGHQLLHEAEMNFNIETPVTAQKINALPLVAQQTRKVLGFGQLTEAQMAKLQPFITTQTRKAYPNLSNQATQCNGKLANLHSRTIELPEYSIQLTAHHQEESLKAQQEALELQKRQLAAAEQQARAQQQQAALAQREREIKDYAARYSCTEEEARKRIINVEELVKLGQAIGAAYNAWSSSN